MVIELPSGGSNCGRHPGAASGKLARRAGAAAMIALVFALSGCAGMIQDWKIRKQAVTDGVDETATAEALVPRLPIIRFDLGEVNPSAEAELELRAAVPDLAEIDPEIFVILVEGHTDATGPAELNQKMARQRAQAVADILIDEGVDPALIEIGGFGPDLPVASNILQDGSDHPSGRRFNRRVEIMVAPRAIAGERASVTASAS